MKISKLLSVASVLAAAATPLAAYASDQPGAAASQWLEEASGGAVNHTTDAGQTLATGNVTRGDGPLNTITGQLVHTRDVDLFCLSITSPAAFSATSSPDGAGYNSLYLFDSTGHAVAGYLGDGSLGHTIANIAAGAATGASPGMFFLAVGRSDFGFGSVDQYPLNLAGASLFNTSATGPFGPLTPNPAVTDPLDHWNSNPAPGFGDLLNTNYTITLTGANFCTTPAPGAAGLLALGGGMVMRRRRR